MPISLGSLQGPVSGRRREAFITHGYSASSGRECHRYSYETNTVSSTSIQFRDRTIDYASGHVIGFAGASNEGVAGYILGGGGNGATLGQADKLAFPSETTSGLSNLSTPHGTSPINTSQQRVEGYVHGGMNNTGNPHSVGEKVSFTTDVSSSTASYPVGMYQGSSSEQINVAGFSSGGKTTTLDANATSARYKLSFSTTTWSSVNGLSQAWVGNRNHCTFQAVYSMGGRDTSAANLSKIDKYVYLTNTNSTLSATTDGSSNGAYTPAWSDWVSTGVSLDGTGCYIFKYATETVSTTALSTWVPPINASDSYWGSLQNSGAL